jgi:FixJ family two-component response regulator/anti-sigma regulatory factor (Ser/Thr protein kinase)
MVEPLARVLVVDDDPASQSFLEIALAKQGYQVVVAGDATEAERELAAGSIDSFSCVVTDYWMPDHTGLELLDWIKERDPSLATILVTAAGEREVMAQSLRSGAVDFLDKPIERGKLQSAVALAVARTRRQRHLTESASAAKELGRAQQRMLSLDASQGAERVEVWSYPKHEAGGDFFSRFRPEPDLLFCLLTDVSGHDLQAAYLSAYFQGMVRGLLTRGAPFEQIFPDFNRFLLEEWNQAEAVKRNHERLGASIAACALVIDFTRQTATVFTQGTPALVYLSPDGEARTVGETGGFPLGWFPEISARGVTCSTARGGAFCLWTDGLEELAEKQGVSPLSLAHGLREGRRLRQEPAWIRMAGDDILLAIIHLSQESPGSEHFWPLLSECYQGGQEGEIDQFQSYWRRSLMIALPELSEQRLHDCLLASREALLNAIKHGCGGRPEQHASFQVGYCAERQAVRVRVCDSGPGHHFDLGRHEQLAAEELAEEHRGLILIKHLASRVEFERNGACVVMEFSWPPPQASGPITI